MSAAYIGAWLLVAVAGTAMAGAFAAPRQPGRWPMSIGYGLVLGMLATAACTSLLARDDTNHAWLRGAFLLAAAGVAGAAIVAWRQWRAPAAGGNAGRSDRWRELLAAVGLASLVWRGSLIGSEVLLRPTYPWDAWDAWAVKSKTWFLLGHFAPFVAVDDWLRQAPAELYSGPAWAYPSTLAWMQVWFASAAGGWIEQLVNLPWVVLWVALLLGHYGQWRALGLSRVSAALFVYVLGSLPLLDTHAALAGYADLWIAALFGFALLAWLRWQERRERDQLLLALVCAAVLPLIKLEGMVWLLCLLAAIGFGMVPPRWRWRAVGAAAAALVVIVLIGQSQLLFAAIGWVRSGSHVVEIPVIGKLAFTWHGNAALGLLRSLFVQSNWHLLWWIVVPVVVWRWRALRASDALSLCALLLLGCLVLLVVLFVFTDAAEWAESYTAVNRLVLHIVPGVVTLLALLMREPARLPAPTRTAPASGPQPDPA